MNKITKLSCCRICNSKNLKKILHLKDMPLTDEFVKKKDIGKEFLHDINIYICEDCFVVQTQHDVDVDRYYLDYQYSVAHSQKANKFMKKLAKNIKTKYFNKSSNKSVLEIGSGDGKQLAEFKKLGFKVLGYEPSKKLSEIANLNNIETINDLYTKKSINYFVKKKISFDVILLTYTFDHLPKPGEFLKMTNKLLNDDSILVIEVHDLEKIFKNNEYCLFEHEHSIYLTEKSAKKFLKLHGYQIIDFDLVDNKDRRANSLIFVAQKTEKNKIKSLPDVKTPKEFNDLKYYLKLSKKIRKGISNLDNYIKSKKECGKRVAGYGAGGRGVMTLAALKNSNYLDFLIEKNPKSNAIFSPGSSLPVVNLDHLKNNSVNEILVFSYGYIDEIKKDLSSYGYNTSQIKSFIDIMSFKNE